MPQSKRFTISPLRLLFLLLPLLSSLAPHHAEAKSKQPIIQNLLWDTRQLTTTRQQGQTDASYKTIVAQAESYLLQPPVAVTDKTITRSGNKHNFEALSVYTWPNPDDPDGPYIVRDGEYNPEYMLYDLPRLNLMVARTKAFSRAYFVTGEERFRQALCTQLDTWFVNKDTRMTPHFEYNQFIPGHNNGKGNKYGIIDAYNFIDVIESIYLAEQRQSLGRRRMKALKQWFADFAKWMTTSEMGKAEAEVANNHGTAYDVTLFSMCHFAGDDDTCNSITANFAKRRINPQIKEDGSQPLELERTRSFHYSVFNLNHFLDFCLMQQRLGNDYIATQGSRIKTAIDFLSHHLNNTSDYPYQEIGDWQSIRQEFITLQRRAESIKAE